ncbi:MAG: phosphate ABC transporter substrate-binding protein PstS [Campylobacterales bacterium]|nr:phosphate ABC transporter substrate-binding protein PstS [Campylobacterales bacterium]
MKTKLFYRLILVSILTATSLYANSSISGRGASFPSTVYIDWAEAYEEATGNKIHYSPTGSGDGIISIKRRMVDFGGSDKPLQPWRLERYNLSMFPTIIGSIVLAYNIPGIKDNELKLSEKAIAAIFSGEAKYWDDPVIKAHNYALLLPHKRIKVAVRSDESGTTFNFTYYLRKIDYDHFHKASTKFDWKAETIEGKGNGGVSDNIKNNEYAIGYIEYSYKQKENLSAATVENKAGHWISPSINACKDGAQYSNMHMNNDFFAMITYPEGETSYPIIATSFILLPNEKKGSNGEIIAFFKWVFENGEDIAKKHGYAFLPKSTIEEIKFYWKSKKLL